MSFVFVGERRSAKAVQMGVCWEDEALAARPLFHALRHHGFDPQAQHFINLFEETVAGPFRVNDTAEPIVRSLMFSHRIVAMGNRVSRELDRLDIPHVKIVHPAARGKIRLRENYIAHVGEQILGG